MNPVEARSHFSLFPRYRDQNFLLENKKNKFIKLAGRKLLASPAMSRLLILLKLDRLK